MMTKKMLCRKVIEEFKESSTDRYLMDYKDEELVPFIFSSTSLGISLEYLGVITKEKYPTEFEYLSHRGGIFQTYYDRETNEVCFLTFRELLSLLPDELDEKNKGE